MIVVAPGGDASFYDGLTNPKSKPTAAPRRLEVPITGRRFSGRAAHQLAPIDMPDAASRFLEQMSEPAGLLLLDTQNRPVAWITTDATELTKLRTGDSATGAAPIMRALERPHASNIMIQLTSDYAASIEKIGRAHICTPVTTAHP